MPVYLVPGDLVWCTTNQLGCLLHLTYQLNHKLTAQQGSRDKRIRTIKTLPVHHH